MNPQSIVLATGNLGKVAELATLLAPLGWHVQPQLAWNVPPCPEPYPTFIENALAKARHAAQYTGLPAIADDSGLCVAALGGLPGVQSARYACLHADSPCDDARNNAKLLTALQGVPDSQRHAYFVCALVAVRSPIDPEPLIAIGRWQGSIATHPTGTHGFGYDPVFMCTAHGVSAASLNSCEKSAVSHRGLAAMQLRELINCLWLK